MKKLFTILAVIAAFFAILFSVLPISNLAILPAIGAFAFGFAAFYLSKKTGEVKKIIPFTFYLTICALTITTYKALFNTPEVVNTEVLEEIGNIHEEEAIDELESLDLDALEIEDTDLESIDINDTEIEDIQIETNDIESIEINESDIENSEEIISELEELEIN